MRRLCISCNGTNEFDAIHRLEFGAIASCRKCGFVLMEPATAAMSSKDYSRAYYEGGISGAGYGGYFGNEMQIRSATARAFAGSVRSICGASKKILDLGCGGGYFVKACLDLGLDATGIDFSSDVIRLAQEAFGQRLPLRCGTVSEELASGRRYGAVALLDVIEHVDDPVLFLELAGQLLVPDAPMVILTPRFDGWLYREQGANYIQFKPDHLFHFTEKDIVRVLERAGAKSWEVSSVGVFLARGEVVDPAVLSKYAKERDHMVVVCRFR